MALRICRQSNFLKGSDYADYEKSLGKMIKFRNALVHGRVEFEDGSPTLHYYEGGARSVLVDDAFWDEQIAYIAIAEEKTVGLQALLNG